MNIYVGARVCRGRDWKWGRQDSGDGHLGIVRSFESNEEVVIVWDNGTAANYRCFGQFDLRVYDSSSAGIQHPEAMCDTCRQQPIWGIRWKCAACLDYDLCSACYHGDKHHLRHRFYRICESGGQRMLVETRRKCKKIHARGLLPGARVIRGFDWQWEDQDGGKGRKGKITDIQGWNPKFPNSGAYVLWDTGERNLYRIAHNGMSDLKCITDAKGASYYRDHLPALGESNPARPLKTFSIGDVVTVLLAPAIVQSLQHGHGGWTDAMSECLGAEGRVVGIDEDSDILVEYSNSKNKWTFNQAVLTRKTSAPVSDVILNQEAAMSSVPMVTLRKNDIVRISGDPVKVKRLQKGHGEWTDKMLPLLGKVGKVIEVFGDNNVKVAVNGSCKENWVLNPLVVEFVANFKGSASAVTVRDKLVTILSSLADNETDLLLWSAILNKSPLPTNLKILIGNANFGKIFGFTPVLYAAYFGYSTGISILMSSMPYSPDDIGDGPLHYTAYGGSDEAITMILDGGFEINSRNNHGQTPLHVAVIRERVKVVRKLLECGAATSLRDADGSSPLHHAIVGHRDDIVSILMVNGADPAVKDEAGMNVLQLCAAKGSIGALKVLLDEAYLVNRVWVLDEQSDTGDTAIHYAVAQPNEECLESLLGAGANPTVQAEPTGQTSLHIAASNGHIAQVRVLLKVATNFNPQWVNVQDKQGDSMLHHLIKFIDSGLSSDGDHSKGSLISSIGSLVQLAVSVGADIHLKNETGESPIELCKDPNLKNLIERAVESAEKSTSSLRKKVNNHISSASLNNSSETKRCGVCMENKINVVMLPCNHMFSCDACSTLMKKCLKCKEIITSKFIIPTSCYLCEEKPPVVQFNPCLHVMLCQNCSSTPKSCIKCRVPIESKTPIFQIDTPLQVNNGTMSLNSSIQALSITKNIVKDSTNTDIALRTLQGKYQELRDRVICAICLDKVMNMVFLCGHGVCQMCGDRCTDCPICRKKIERKILLYCQ